MLASWNKFFKSKSLTKIITTSLCAAFLMVSFGCSSFNKNQKSVMTELVGNDQDEHGCIQSAGYTWSEIRDSCIRVFELTDVMYHPDDSLHSNPCYFILSEDLFKVEIFQTSIPTHLVLHKNGLDWSNAERTHTFTSFTDSTCELRHQSGKLLFEGAMP